MQNLNEDKKNTISNNKEINSNFYDVIILGDSPSSYTACIYAKTANMKILFLQPTENKEINEINLGKLKGVDKYPGFIISDDLKSLKDENIFNSKSTEIFIEKLKEQVDGFGIKRKNIKDKLVVSKYKDNLNKSEVYNLEINFKENLTVYAKYMILEMGSIKYIENYKEDALFKNFVKFIQSEGEVVNVCADGCKKFLELKEYLL